jgi:hypothetical protein
LVVEVYLLRKRKCFASDTDHCFAIILTPILTPILTIALAKAPYERPTHPVLHGHGIGERQLGPGLMCLKFIL